MAPSRRAQPHVGACTTINTPFRRPCLLRAVLESNVDAPEGRRPSLSIAHGQPGLTTQGSNGPDRRTITVDSGLRRGSVDVPVHHEPPSKCERVQANQAFGLGYICDMDINTVRRNSFSAPEPGSPENRSRTKTEELQGVPLSGKGADIDKVIGRRVEGLPSRGRQANQSEERTPLEKKRELDCISIGHQFQRRHFSEPPEARSREDFKHVVRAEGYANLLNRPEGTGKRTVGKRISPPGSPVQQKPFRVAATPGSLFQPSPYINRGASAIELDNSDAEEAALTPNRRRQSMESRQSIESTQSMESLASIESNTAIFEPRPRVASSVKGGESPRTPKRSMLSAGKSRSTQSLLSAASTGVGSEGLSFLTPSASIKSGPESPVSGTSIKIKIGFDQDRSRLRACRTSACRTLEYERDQQFKAKRRAAWVA